MEAVTIIPHSSLLLFIRCQQNKEHIQEESDPEDPDVKYMFNGFKI